MNEIYYRGLRLLPLKSDIVFKAIFGKNENRDLLASFLSCVLEIDIESPEAIEFTNTELTRDYEEDKLSRLDVRIKLSNQDHVDVEIQIRDRFDMIKRSIYYLSKLYTDQMTKGMSYSELGRAISLNTLDYNLLNEKEYFNRYRFKNTRDNTELTDIIEVDYLELRKVPNEYHSMKDMWAMLIATESEEVIDMLANKNEAMHKVVEKLKYVTADDITRFQYDQRQKAELDYYAEIKRNREVGREEGREQGIEKGIEQGKLEIAKNLLDILDDETISKKTGLTIEQVRKLRD